MTPKILTTIAAAEKIGCTIQHARLLIRKRKLPATKVGRDWLIESTDLFKFLDGRKARL